MTNIGRNLIVIRPFKMKNTTKGHRRSSARQRTDSIDEEFQENSRRERELHRVVPTPTTLSAIAERTPLLNRPFIIARVAIRRAWLRCVDYDNVALTPRWFAGPISSVSIAA